MKIESEISRYLAQGLSLPPQSVAKVLALLYEEECTIPFIARYRKEATGGLDEVQIGAIKDHYETYLEVEKRRAYILETIQKMEKLTPELKNKILQANTLNQLEDLYAPYKSKKKTKAQIAREQGLEPLAELIKSSSESLQSLEKKNGAQFINEHIKTFEDAISGAEDIITEEIAHNVELKENLRERYWKEATLKSTKHAKADENKEAPKFKDYFEFEQKILELKNPKVAHRFLAIRRAQDLKILKVEIIFDENQATQLISTLFNLSQLGCRATIEKCIARAYKFSIHSSLTLEIKNELKKLSDESAIDVFGINLKNLLLQPYLGPKSVIGIDPGIRTGCKVAVIDKNGVFLADTVIYPERHPQEAIQILQTCIDQLDIKHIAIGNGTYGRETLQFIQQKVPQVKAGKTKAMLVNEDGASVYSASEIARKEFPDKDVTVRGAISIARRFQDPLAELVKIDPKSIGVGQYQHDVNQVRLKKSLESVVENCVNYVGVDLNTASSPLLSFVSGITPTVADNIVKQRKKLKGFKNRKELLKITRFTQKVFEQAAGFLRIYQSENPLDGTFIHPERYEILEKWCKDHKITLQELTTNPSKIQLIKNDQKLKTELGEFTHQDIVKCLQAPSQDPRTEFVSFEYRNDISTISDLKKGQWYPGIVTNITQFGAFVDIGIKENGLIHVSQMADKFVENAFNELKVGQEVKARVIEVDNERGRISLSLKSDSADDSVPAPKGSSDKKTKRKPPTQELKNNAFAALSNLKLK
ncbi:MAG: RNA-binding transcriptional accessory protein [Halobacteriovoraceae bacterium]|nr:RNA-binding transcriptional accessory protein [Halobacteriovoraceae bacterium]MCB9095330.1 RNA-binding transcriptional accessory protein [Halobacteriovoraceae bacterium]